MTKGQLKDIVAQLEAQGVADNVEVKVQMSDGSRIALKSMPFIVEGQDASWSIDASGHWASLVAQQPAVVLEAQ